MSLARICLEFETPRLLLKPIAMTDADGLHEIYSDSEAMLYWSDTPSADLAETGARIIKDLEYMEQQRGVFWSIRHKDHPDAVGKCALIHYSEQNRRAEIGFILSRRLWGQGLMKEACGALLDAWFETLGLHRVEADTDIENVGSRALLESLGFVQEGLFRDRWLVGNRWADSVMYGLLKEDWTGRTG